MKTSELTGTALDWAVAKCEGLPVSRLHWSNRFLDAYEYSIEWSKGGPIIERESINLVKMHGHGWHADCGKVATGPTPLIAAMRCYVASKLGDEVEIPEELLSYRILTSYNEERTKNDC